MCVGAVLTLASGAPAMRDKHQRSCQLLAAVHFKNSCSGADDAGLVLLDAADRLRSDDATHAYSR